MSEPWFDPNVWSWLPGTVFGTLVGIMGGIGGTLASMGKAKSLVMTAWYLFMLVAVALLIAAITAVISGQPYGVWYGLGLPGVSGVMIMGPLTVVMNARYREAELRTMAAKDL